MDLYQDQTLVWSDDQIEDRKGCEDPLGSSEVRGQFKAELVEMTGSSGNLLVALSTES